MTRLGCGEFGRWKWKWNKMEIQWVFCEISNINYGSNHTTINTYRTFPTSIQSNLKHSGNT